MKQLHREWRIFQYTVLEQINTENGQNKVSTTPYALKYVFSDYLILNAV